MDLHERLLVIYVVGVLSAFALVLWRLWKSDLELHKKIALTFGGGLAAGLLALIVGLLCFGKWLGMTWTEVFCMAGAFTLLLVFGGGAIICIDGPDW